MTPADFRTARKSLGLTQTELAVVLGYSDGQARVSQIERGEMMPHGSVIRLLQAYLDGYRPGDWPKD
jgi:transcriptional regulator with XRE-family HTH domain